MNSCYAPNVAGYEAVLVIGKAAECGFGVLQSSLLLHCDWFLSFHCMLDRDQLMRAVQLTRRSQTYRMQLQALSAIVQFIRPTRYLEVGAFEGRSALLFSSLSAIQELVYPVHVTSVDSWQGGDEHQQEGLAMGPIEATFDEVIQVCRSWLPVESRFEKLKSLSTAALADLRERHGYYDLILIDAGHKAKDVLQDLVYAWPLLKPRGVMILDDYTWVPKHEVGDRLLHAPKLGIDAFCSCFSDEITILSNLPLLQLYLLKESPLGKHYQAIGLEMPDLHPLFEGVGLVE